MSVERVVQRLAEQRIVSGRHCHIGQPDLVATGGSHRYFKRAARLGSIRKAAQALYIAQPAVSRQIRTLEHEIGSPLFDRTGYRIVLTTTGRRLLAHVDRVLDDMEKP